jgi:hypothetical protein
MVDLILSDDELQALTGRSSKRPAVQLEILLRRGFHRAHINAGGRLVLERAHYDSVCRGEAGAALERKRPQITPPSSLRRSA